MSGTVLRFLILALSTAIFAAPNMFGSRGTMRTHSAKTMGNGKLAIGVSLEGSIDENKLRNKQFYHIASNAVRVDVNGVVQTDGSGNYVKDNTGAFLTETEWNSLADAERDAYLAGNSARIAQNPAQVDSTPVTEVLDMTFRPFIAIGLSNYFDVGVTVPYHMDRITKTDAEASPDLNTVSGNALGDVEIWGKLQYPPYEHDPTFDMALFGMVTVPTGNKDKGFVPKEIYYIPGESKVPITPGDDTYDPKYFSAEQVTATLLMLWTLDFYHLNREVPVELNLNYGITTTVKKNLDNVFILNASLLWHANDMVGFFVDFAGQTRFSKFDAGFDLGADPMLVSLGGQVTTPNGIFFSATLEFGLSDPNPQDIDTLHINDPADVENKDTYYQILPTTSTAFSGIIGWEGHLVAQDRDKDGINDEDDACPDNPEDLDAFDDFDGCPELDNDQDEIEDVDDKCPLDPEDQDGFQDQDGCPEDDNDNDGIKDLKDKCPNAAEDFNQFEDEDGCPEATEDTDKDGIPDVNDRCIDVPEDLDTFEDFDGCPEKDNDKDGIYDELDKCPNAAEVVNGFDDEDGCPDAKPKPKKKPMAKKAKIVLHGVTFESGKATLKETSFEKLADVAQTLVENPQVVIEISGHTDNRGSRKLNSKLSQARAQSVVDYLISQGVGKNQLKAKGYGPSKPVATNRTADGRAKNRRIEMMRVK